jgi:hypothetical protein
MYGSMLDLLAPSPVGVWPPQAADRCWIPAVTREILRGRCDLVRWWLGYVSDEELMVATPSRVEDPPSMLTYNPAVARQEQEQ